MLSQGFIARNSQGETVLLGRGGSDTSGAYLAGKLEARRLEIWTDAPGFFSADPKAVPSARLIKTLHYREAQEIASAGGGILHPRSISPVRASGIPLFLKCTTHPEWEGSVISNAQGDDEPQLKAISHRNGITLVSMESMEMWHQVGFLADAFNVFREHGLSVDLISTSESNVTVSVDVGANVTDRAAIEALAEDLRKLCKVTVIGDCAAITLVGRRIRTILHELGPVLEIFQEQQVHLVTQAANDLNLTFVVSSEHAYKLVQHLHGLLVNKFEGGVFGATWEQLTGGAPAAKARSEAVVGQEEGAAARDRRGTRRHLRLRPREHRARDRVVEGSAVRGRRVLRDEGEPESRDLAARPRPRLELRVRVAGRDRARAGKVLRRSTAGEFSSRRTSRREREYEQALEQGVWVTLDNLFPLRHWAKAFKNRELFVRIDTGQGRGHHEHVRTAGAHSKFGVPLFEIDELVDLAKKAGARIVGLHAHTGSGVLTPDAWLDTGRQLLLLLERLPDVRHVDVGGGLGVPEKAGQAGLDLRALDGALKEIKQGLGGRALWLEPGRYVVAQAGVLLARVTQTKGKGDVQYVGVGTGMNSLIRPALYGAYHDIVNLTRLGKPATELVTIVGPICETGDRLGSDRLLPPAKENDVLLVANAGAYGYAMSSRYNLREPAVEVMI